MTWLFLEDLSQGGIEYINQICVVRQCGRASDGVHGDGDQLPQQLSQRLHHALLPAVHDEELLAQLQRCSLGRWSVADQWESQHLLGEGSDVILESGHPLLQITAHTLRQLWIIVIPSN